MGLSSTLSNCILKTSSDGDSTASLGRLFQWMIVLTVKKKNQTISVLCRGETSLLVQLVPVAPCLLHVAPCEERASVLFVATL